jgi:hypothetical protein
MADDTVEMADDNLYVAAVRALVFELDAFRHTVAYARSAASAPGVVPRKECFPPSYPNLDGTYMLAAAYSFKEAVAKQVRQLRSSLMDRGLDPADFSALIAVDTAKGGMFWKNSGVGGSWYPLKREEMM